MKMRSEKTRLERSNLQKDESCGVKSMPGVGVKSNKTELVAVSEGRDGKTVYDLGCAACHNAGLAGAPLLGDQAQWASRLDKGLQTLTDNAYNGYNAMPAKVFAWTVQEKRLSNQFNICLML